MPVKGSCGLSVYPRLVSTKILPVVAGPSLGRSFFFFSVTVQFNIILPLWRSTNKKHTYYADLGSFLRVSTSEMMEGQPSKRMFNYDDGDLPLRWICVQRESVTTRAELWAARTRVNGVGPLRRSWTVFRGVLELA